MPERHARRCIRLRTLSTGVSLAMAACALPGPAGLAPPSAAPLDAEEIGVFADLLQLEDRRSWEEETVARALAHSSSRVRARAVLSVGRIRAPGSAGLVVPLLADPDSGVAASAAFSLGQLGDSSAVAALAGPLRPAEVRSRPTVAAEAAYALGKLGSGTAADTLDAFLSRASGDDPHQAGAVGSALLAIWRIPGRAAGAAVGRWLASPDPGLRWRSAYALARRPSPAAARLLLPLASDPDPGVRAQAVRALTSPLVDSAGVGIEAGFRAVLAALGDTDYAVRINAIRTLGSYRHPGSVAALRERAAADAPHERLAALESLGRLGPVAAEASPFLRQLVERDAEPVALRAAALDAIARVDPPMALDLAEKVAASPLWRLRAAAARTVAALAPEGDPRFRSVLSDPDPRVGAAALQLRVDSAGGRLEALRPTLLEQLGSRDVMVRTAALSGLARLADPATMPQVLDALARAHADTLNDAALAAVDALAAIPGPAGARALFARVPRSPDYLVRLRVEERFGDAARSAWGPALPIEVGRARGDYLRLVRGFEEPALAGQGPELLLHSASGSLRVRLFGDAPLTVESILELVDRGYFDGQEWPRVVPNFVVQGGDPRGDTSGGPGYSIRDEIGRRRYGVGTLGMALSGPDTGGSQFFLTHSPQPHLDGTYAIFGELVEGLEVIQELLPGERILRVERVR